MVVGRLYAGHAREGPQRRPVLEQVLGEGAVAAVAGALARRRLKQRSQFFLKRSNPGGQFFAIATIPVVIPGEKETRSDGKPGFAELLLVCPALGMGGEVSGQMGLMPMSA